MEINRGTNFKGLKRRDEWEISPIPSPRKDSAPNPNTDSQNDFEIGLEWVNQAYSSGNRAQRIRELRRLFHWLEKNEVTLSEMTTTKVQAYLAYVRNPPSEDCGPALPFKTKNGQRNPLWRPFVSGLSDSSFEQMRVILGAFFDYLAGIGWIERNMWRVAAKKRRGETLHSSLTRLLSDSAIQFIFDCLSQYPEDSLKHQLTKARSQLMFASLSFLGLRRAELASLRMGDFSQSENGSWWVTVTGKGNKQGRVPVPKGFIPYLMKYRILLGLPPAPSILEKSPMLLTLTRPVRAMSERAIYKSLKVSLELMSVKSSDERVRNELRVASTHWFRHSYATQLIKNGVPLLHVQENLRHAYLSTTQKYTHVLDEERQESITGFDPTA